ncbi:hypothetical protein CACET_c08240 [Clostridium aceticum]|uniref:Uncharacterized protein n=1 Tax=Clostridium aceticum TaxID=84022 RepID=A0A0D8I5U6_9CLOT|nr:hypothetical protein [Clostridium aceticum]AKL94333.1 hypothetical protein CACET_c08240 [Clostridium aceticum]KJF25419.1 hypothetical protein TZ02_18855 [Clostridium aceticum]
MENKKRLEIGVEMTDEELMNLVGGFESATSIDTSFLPILKYGIRIPRDSIIVTPLYGIQPIPKYGIQPMYGIKPIDTKLI